MARSKRWMILYLNIQMTWMCQVQQLINCLKKKKLTFKEATPKNEVKVEAKADDIDLEIEDDTPPEDRNKEPLPKEVVEEIRKRYT